MSVTAPQLPAMNLFAQDAYAYLEPIAGQDEELGFPLAIVCGAIGMAFDQVEAIVRAQPGRQPYQQALDVTVCPDDRVPGLLGWLGQFVGVPWVPYTDSEAKRTQVQAEAQFYRGTPGNLQAAIAPTQTQPGRVIVLERDPDAWGMVIGYDPAYTTDPVALQDAAQGAIPWGIGLQVSPISVPMFEEGTRLFENQAAVTFEAAALTDIT